MFILKPYIFNRYPEIIFGFSTKSGTNNNSSFDFNLSYSVGDNKKVVDQNRELFFKSVGLSSNSVVFQKQVHSDVVKIVDCAGDIGESDALITNVKNLGIAVIVADCTPVFLYDHKERVIAAIHAGWRGTEQKILLKALQQLERNYNTQPQNLIAYLGPSISTLNYEVGSDVAEKFDHEFVHHNDGKLFLDVSGVNLKMLMEFGVPQNQIQKSELCTFEYKSLFHSYRRDREKSGRAMGVIALKY